MRLPLVDPDNYGARFSIIVPTGDRALLLRRCIQQIAVQNGLRFVKDIVIVDGGERALYADTTPVRFVDLDVSYVRVGRETTVGDRRNIAVENAKGSVIMHFDDDDFYSHRYVERLVRFWTENECRDGIELGGASQFWHYDFLRKRGWKTDLWDCGHPYGATFMFRKETWKRLGGFQSLQRGEDQEFFLAIERAGLPIRALADPGLYVYMRHMKNVSGYVEPVRHADWTRAARDVLGGAVAFYDDLAELVNVPTLEQEGHQFHLPPNLRGNTN